MEMAYKLTDIVLYIYNGERYMFFIIYFINFI